MLNTLNAPPLRPSNPTARAPLSILAIDDESSLLGFVQLCCRSKSWKVTVLSDLQHGIELDRNNLPDVILCDAAMPYLSGPQLIAMLKANPSTAKIPVVLMSGFATVDLFPQVPWSGFLEKPFTRNELHAAIESAAAQNLDGK